MNNLVSILIKAAIYLGTIIGAYFSVLNFYTATQTHDGFQKSIFIGLGLLDLVPLLRLGVFPLLSGIIFIVMGVFMSKKLKAIGTSMAKFASRTYMRSKLNYK